MPKLMKSLKSVDNQYITLLVLILLLASCNPKKENVDQIELLEKDSIYGDVEFCESKREYTLFYEKDTIQRILSFRRNNDSILFDHINYQTTHNQKIKLSDEIKYIDGLWETIDYVIDVQLKSIMVGYPLEYKDVLINHIEALKEIGNFDINNFDLLRSIMLSKHVYQPLETYLKSRGYQLTKISTEKHGYVPKDDLKELGYPDSLKIPVPYMVWLEVKPNY